MAILNIIKYPNEHLHLVASPVEVFDEDLQIFVNNMLETMYEKNGVGLAATQVDVQQRVAVIDVSEERNQPLVFINPEIISREGEVEGEEGCLSIPGVYDKVWRSEKVIVKAFNEKGEAFELNAEGLLSVCIQHEIDHLNGVLFIEHLSQLKQNRIHQKTMKQLKKELSA